MNPSQKHDFGGTLRAARESAGLSLRYLADRTKHSASAFDALEKNRITLLPGGIYRRAIVRAYAAEVGLDPEATLRAFLALYPDDVPTADMLNLAGTPRRGPLRALLGLVGAIIPIVGGIVYFTQAVRVDDAPKRTASRPAPPVESAADASRVTYEQSPVTVMLSVSTRTELAVAAGGRQVIARVVEPGETLRVELSTDVTLAGDDAGAVHVSINGRAARPLGAAGAPLEARIERASYQDWLVNAR